MDIDAAITHLQSLGLYVDRHVPGGMTDHQATDGLTIARELHDDGDLAALVDACFVFRLRDGWVLRKPKFGGPIRTALRNQRSTDV